MVVEDRLKAVVRALSEGWPRRHVWQPEQLAGACGYVEGLLAQACGRAVERQLFTARFWADSRGARVEHLECVNLAVDLPGTEKPERILIVGAHYDSRVGMRMQQGTVPCFEWDGVPEAARCYQDTPGANDNASGVAALVALAEMLAAEPLPITVRLVSWANEEYPFFRNRWAKPATHPSCDVFFADGMGSFQHARRCVAAGESIVGVLALDTLGCYRQDPDYVVEGYPAWKRAVLRRIFPSGGDYVAFMSNRRSRRFLRQVHAHYTAVGTVPAIRRSFPLMDTLKVGWSDDWAYWQFGIPGLIVTDTAYIRSCHYHRVTDTADRLDYPETAKVVLSLGQAIPRTCAQLAGRVARLSA